MSTETDIVEELRERTAFRYAGDCKCGGCQLVARKTIDRAMQEIAKLRSERDRAVLRGKTLRCAGTLMANTMYNLSQRGEMTDYMRGQMRKMQQGWDRASAVFATTCAIPSEGQL